MNGKLICVVAALMFGGAFPSLGVAAEVVVPVDKSFDASGVKKPDGTEEGARLGIKYRFYHFDGSGVIAGTRENDLAPLSKGNWSISCRKDAMTDRVACSASQGHLFIYYPKNGAPYIDMLGDKYPGSIMFIRVNGGKVYSASEDGMFGVKQSKEIFAAMKDGSKVATRYSDWPYNSHMDDVAEIHGVTVVLQYMKWVSGFIK